MVQLCCLIAVRPLEIYPHIFIKRQLLCKCVIVSFFRQLKPSRIKKPNGCFFFKDTIALCHHQHVSKRIQPRFFTVLLTYMKIAQPTNSLQQAAGSHPIFALIFQFLLYGSYNLAPIHGFCATEKGSLLVALHLSIQSPILMAFFTQLQTNFEYRYSKDF